MHARLASFLLITSAVILSFLSVSASDFVISFFVMAYPAPSMADVRGIIPAPTLFVGDHPPLVAVTLAAVCLLSLLAVWRLPGQVWRCVAVGLGVQWLVVWGVAFCLCYYRFLGSVSMHHPQWFEFDQFLSLSGGVFPVSFVLIVSLLIVALLPVRRPA